MGVNANTLISPDMGGPPVKYLLVTMILRCGPPHSWVTDQWHYTIYRGRCANEKRVWWLHQSRLCDLPFLTRKAWGVLIVFF